MVNGKRIEKAQTIEEKLAALAVTLISRSIREKTFPPDYADFRDAFRPFLEVEIAVAQLSVIDLAAAERAKRKIELVRKLAGLDLSGLARQAEGPEEKPKK